VPMASFVREVLSATGHLNEKDDLALKALRLHGRIEELKSGLCDVIAERYDDLGGSFADSSATLAQLEAVFKEADSHKNAVNHIVRPGIQEASKELNDIIDHLSQLSESVQNAKVIKNAYLDMERINEKIDQRKYLDAAALLQKLDNLICLETKCPDDPVMRKSLANIGKELTTARDAIHFALGKDWDNHVDISVMDGDQDSGDVIALKIDFHGSGGGQGLARGERVRQLVKAMEDAGMLTYRLSKFGGKLMDLVLVPLMVRDTHWINVVDSRNLIEIKFRKDQDDSGKSAAASPKDVMAGLEQVFAFLADNLADKEVIGKLGCGLGRPFCQELVKRCIAPSVPNRREDLSSFSIDVVDHAHMLQQTLQEIGFLPPEETSITDYLANTENLVINKRCQQLLCQARSIMQSDLLSTEILDPATSKDDHVEETLRDIGNIDIDAEMESMIPEEFVSQEVNIFIFPKCEVSKSVLELVKLIEETLDESLTSNSRSGAVRLYGTARSILQMYSDVVPVAHRQILEKLPQAAALAFNNSMLLAHKAMTLSPETAARCGSSSGLPPNASLADLVLDIRRNGAEMFLTQMRAQRDQLRAILRDSSGGLGQLSGDGLLPAAAADKCIRQVSHQMLHLRNVWSSVLPSSIYKRAVGTVFNSVVEELIGKVVALEDIAADSANQISSLYLQVQEQGPKVFEDRRDVVVYVKRWTKFCELILILNASLREIDDRWSCGKGPLAAVFEPEEVKRLIRALFQNTDRRSQVLARVKLS